jgi:hypothetical protein
MRRLRFYAQTMFKRFRPEGVRVPRMRIADGQMQMESMGRLPNDVAAGGPEQAPTPEYIAEAATPSEDVWQREQALYRAKNRSSNT